MREIFDARGNVVGMAMSMTEWHMLRDDNRTVERGRRILTLAGPDGHVTRIPVVDDTHSPHRTQHAHQGNPRAARARRDGRRAGRSRKGLIAKNPADGDSDDPLSPFNRDAAEGSADRGARMLAADIARIAPRLSSAAQRATNAVVMAMRTSAIETKMSRANAEVIEVGLRAAGYRMLANRWHAFVTEHMIKSAETKPAKNAGPGRPDVN